MPVHTLHISTNVIKESARDLLRGYVPYKQRASASANMLIAWMYAYLPYEWASEHDAKLTAARAKLERV